MLKPIVRKFFKRIYLFELYAKMSEIKTCRRKKLSDERFLKIRYKENTGEELDLKNPQSFNEKLQWLKLYSRDEILTLFADKFRVRDYLKNRVGSDILIPIVGGPWLHPEDIDYEKLPDKFVLKCNHDCGSVIIVPNKNLINQGKINRQLAKALSKNYFWQGREWPYKNINRLIFAEKYMVDENNQELKDYKFHCFSGKVELIHVDFNRSVNHKRNLYDPSWGFMEAEIQYSNDKSVIIPKPPNLEKMKIIAEKISTGFPYLRIDLYTIDSDIYFGEITMYHGGGMENFTPKSLNVNLGLKLDLDL